MARKKKRNEVLVGVYTIVALALLLFLIFSMGGLEDMLEERTIVRARFQDVLGLRVGDPVFLFGMKVGTVQGVDVLPPEPDAKAVLTVTLAFPERFRTYIRSNTQVKIGKSITGSLSVLIKEPDADLGPALPEGDDVFLEGSVAPDISDIADDMSGLLAEAEGAVAGVTKMLERIETSGNLDRTLEEVATVAGRLRTDLDPILTSMKDTIASLKETLDEGRGLISENREDVRETVASLKGTVASADGFLERLDPVPGKLDDALQTFRDSLGDVRGLLGDNRPHVDGILEDLSVTANNAANLTAEIKRRPWRLLYRPDPEELEAMELYDAAWAYNLGTSELHRSVRVLEDRLRKTEPDEDKRRKVEDALSRVRASIDRYREAEETFWEKLGEAE